MARVPSGLRPRGMVLLFSGDFRILRIREFGFGERLAIGGEAVVGGSDGQFHGLHTRVGKLPSK